MAIEIVEIKFVEKEQDWENETTRYIFDVEGKEYIIADQNGELTLLDSDGCPTLNTRADQYLFKALIAKLNKMMRKVNPNIKPIQYWTYEK
tara:strand:- start:475 stop:747 length:273 start_codon:yes stop_codon:yes gene_type:complete